LTPAAGNALPCLNQTLAWFGLASPGESIPPGFAGFLAGSRRPGYGFHPIGDPAGMADFVTGYRRPSGAGCPWVGAETGQLK